MSQPTSTSSESEREHVILDITQTRSPLTKKLDITHLETHDLRTMLALLKVFAPPQQQLLKGVRFLFMIAGFLWFPIFFPKLLNIAPEIAEPFRKNQTRLYLLLMSLWGFMKFRGLAQYSTLMQLSVQLQKPWYSITLDEIKKAQKLYVFEWFKKLEGSEKKYLHLGLMWLFITLSTGQLIRQLLLLFG